MQTTTMQTTTTMRMKPERRWRALETMLPRKKNRTGGRPRMPSRCAERSSSFRRMRFERGGEGSGQRRQIRLAFACMNARMQTCSPCIVCARHSYSRLATAFGETGPSGTGAAGSSRSRCFALVSASTRMATRAIRASTCLCRAFVSALPDFLV